MGNYLSTSLSGSTLKCPGGESAGIRPPAYPATMESRAAYQSAVNDSMSPHSTALNCIKISVATTLTKGLGTYLRCEYLK